MGLCGSSSDGGMHANQYGVYREVFFDVNPSRTLLGKGEKDFASVDGVQDFKGNPGRVGSLVLTNLRVTWRA